MHRASSQNMYKNQQDAQNFLVIRLYLLLNALHVSDYISPPSGATFISCTSHLLYAGSLTTAARMVPAYTKCDLQLIKVAPDGGLI